MALSGMGGFVPLHIGSLPNVSWLPPYPATSRAACLPRPA